MSTSVNVAHQATYEAEVLSPQAGAALSSPTTIRFLHNGQLYEINSLTHKIGNGDETTIDLTKITNLTERQELIEQAKAVIDALTDNGFTGSSFTAQFAKRYQHADTIGNRIVLWQWPVEETPITLSVTYKEDGKEGVTTFKPRRVAAFEAAVKAPSERLFVRINRVVRQQLIEQQQEGSTRTADRTERQIKRRYSSDGGTPPGSPSPDRKKRISERIPANEDPDNATFTNDDELI